MKKKFWFALFFQKISLNVTFDFRDPYIPLKALKQNKSDQILLVFYIIRQGVSEIKTGVIFDPI